VTRGAVAPRRRTTVTSYAGRTAYANPPRGQRWPRGGFGHSDARGARPAGHQEVAYLWSSRFGVPETFPWITFAVAAFLM